MSDYNTKAVLLDFFKHVVSIRNNGREVTGFNGILLVRDSVVNDFCRDTPLSPTRIRCALVSHSLYLGRLPHVDFSWSDDDGRPMHTSTSAMIFKSRMMEYYVEKGGV